MCIEKKNTHTLDYSCKIEDLYCRVSADDAATLNE